MNLKKLKKSNLRLSLYIHTGLCELSWSAMLITRIFCRPNAILEYSGLTTETENWTHTVTERPLHVHGAQQCTKLPTNLFASVGNRTRAARVAGEHSTTELIPLNSSHYIFCWVVFLSSMSYYGLYTSDFRYNSKLFIFLTQIQWSKMWPVLRKYATNHAPVKLA